MRFRNLFLCCALLAVGGGTARGGDISTITISDAGPDKTIPTDAAFYLAGAAKSATRVQAMILRTDRPYLGTKESCDAVAAGLGTFKAKLAGLNAGRSTADVLWTTGNHKYEVQVSPPWTPADATATDFKILIDHDEEFFSPGHGYCIFVYRDITKTEQLPGVANALLAAFKVAINTCGDKPVCSLDRTTIDAQIAAIADATIQTQVNTAVNDSYKYANDMVRGRAMVRELLNKWGHHPPTQTSIAVTVAQPPAILTGWRAETTIALLAYYAKVLPKSAGTAAKPTIDGYVTPKADFVISGVSFVGADRIRLVPKPPADPSKTSVLDTVKTADLAIPDTTITLRDILELLSGRLPLAKEYLTPEDYLRRLDPLLEKETAALTDDETKTLQAALTSLSQLDTAVEYIHEVHARYTAPNLPDRGSRAAILYGLAEWMIPYEVDCAAANALTTSVVTCSATPGVTGWDTFDAANENPIGRLAAAVERFATAQPQWIKARPLIPSATTTPTAVAAPLSVALNYTRDTWFFSFVSPVIGYAFIAPTRSGDREDIMIRYYGLQIHHTPNPEHLPTYPWRPGGLALELGAAPDAGSFGPDGRYRGLGGFSPVFLGLGIHLIPYTTLSAGMVIAERRTSTITQEDYRRFYGGYIGLSVDVNIPQLVRTAMDGGTSTSTTK